MAESGVAASAARRGTKKAVAGRLQRVQEALGRAAGRVASTGRRGAARMKQIMGRFGKANLAAERSIRSGRTGQGPGRA